MTLVSGIVLPVFALVLTGFVAGKAGWMKDDAIAGLSTFVFTFAIPVLLFQSMATAKLPDAFPLAFFAAYYLPTLALFGVVLAMAGGNGRGLVDRTMTAMSASYSNVVMLGVPLVVASLGNAGDVPLVVILSTHAAVMFVLVTINAELGRGDAASIAALPLQTVRVLARNPIVVGLLLGIGVNLAGLTLPGTLAQTASLLGDAAIPCAVFSMGASISRYPIRGEAVRIALLVVAKNLVHPALVWLACTQVFALDATWTAVAVILAACPSGINAYLFASRYNSQVAPTATVIVISTAVSMPVLAAAIVLLVGN